MRRLYKGKTWSTNEWATGFYANEHGIDMIFDDEGEYNIKPNTLCE